MTHSRPRGRLLLCLAVLLLGVIAGRSLRLGFLPTWSLPELNVTLRLPEAGELSEVSRRWIVPMESAVRAAGDVKSMAGEVDARGGFLRVRFRAGVDAERKAARLESELGALRRRLPVGTSLQVWPMGQSAGENAAVVWLPAEPLEGGTEARLLDALRRLPEVRSAELAGGVTRELQIRQRRAGQPEPVLRQTIERWLAMDDLGNWREGGRIRPIRTTSSPHLFLGERPVRQGDGVLPLASVAEIELVEEDPPWAARRNGEPGRVLLVEREVDASPLDLGHSLRQTLGEFGLADRAHFLLEEARPLRQMLSRLGWGLLFAALASVLSMTALAGWRAGLAQGLVLPVALAAALNAFRLADLDLDLTTLPSLALALAAGLVVYALRQMGRGWVGGVTMIAGAVALPVAVSLAGGRMAPLLLGAVEALALAVTAVVLGVSLPPVMSVAPRPPRWMARALKGVFRRPWTMILGVGTATYLCFILAGKVLEPREARLSPGLMDVGVFLSFPEGSTLEQSGVEVGVAERHLAQLEEVEGVWSLYDARGATVGLELRPKALREDRLRRLVRRLRAELGTLGSAAEVVPYAGGRRGGGEPLRFSDSLEDEAELDEDLFHYRAILRGTDLRTLLSGHERLIETLRSLRWEVTTHLIRTDWRSPTIRLELSPRPGVDLGAAKEAMEVVRRRSVMPPSRPLDASGKLSLRVLAREAPHRLDEVPPRVELLGLQPAVSGGPSAQPLVVSDLITLREEVGSPGLKRQGGRFVLPVNARIRGRLRAVREDRLHSVQYRLYSLPLPPGVDLELPRIGRFDWSEERLRLLTIAGALPLLLLALAAMRLNDLSAALAAVGVLGSGLAVACLPILSATGRVDELTLLALGASFVVILPISLEITATLRASRGAPLAGGAAFRWLSRRLPEIATALLTLGVLLWGPGLALDPTRQPWVLPLRAAGTSGVVAGLMTLVFLPAALRTRRPPPKEVVERRQRPPSWYGDEPLEFSVRNLTKIYGNGHHALHGVNFRLEPGIVGLLGPNGAGKTTLLRILCGLLEPTRGQVSFRGVPIEPGNLPAYRRLVGFLPQDFNAYEGFTAEQFLDYWALERGLDRRARQQEIDRLITLVGLEEAARRKVRDFSGGMRRRIGIARALLGDPPIVIVDEPTTGLDVESRNRLRESLLSVAGERIILFSTHIASDVAATASRILLLHRGHLLYDGAAASLVDQAQGRVFETLLDDEELREFSHRYRITTRVRTLEGIRVRAVTFGEQEPAGELVIPNLEEAYLAMIGEVPGSREEVSKGLGASLLDVDAWRTRGGSGRLG